MTDDIGSRLRAGMSKQEMEDATGREVTLVTESELLARLIEPAIAQIDDALKAGLPMSEIVNWIAGKIGGTPFADGVIATAVETARRHHLELSERERFYKEADKLADIFRRRGAKVTTIRLG